MVKVSLKSEVENATKVLLDVTEINGKPVSSSFSKYYVPALLKITQNNGKGKDTTTYYVEVENDTSDSVGNLKLFIGASCDGEDEDACTLVASKDSLSEWSDNKLAATNGTSAASITAISYTVWTGDPVVILKSEFENFFENAYGDDDLMVYSNSN